MKKFFSMFGFASLLMLSFAFTPADKLVEEAAMDCSGEIGACVVSFVTPGTTVTISIYDEGTTTNPVFTGNALSCDSSPIANLASGKYDVVIESSINATVEYRWGFCAGTVASSGSVSATGGGFDIVGQLEI